MTLTYLRTAAALPPVIPSLSRDLSWEDGSECREGSLRTDPSTSLGMTRIAAAYRSEGYPRRWSRFVLRATRRSLGRPGET